jgi:hypothetical protein
LANITSMLMVIAMMILLDGQIVFRLYVNRILQ